ncbi:MAG: hypothetical protein Roseis2KO_13540 [Roseivirga sp.]
MRKEKEDKALRKAILDLPEHSPAGDLWEDIERSMEPSGAKKGNRHFFKIAAALLLIATAGLIFTGRMTGEQQVKFTEELGPAAELPAAGFLMDQEFMTLLDNECIETRTVCQEVDFQILLNELSELRLKAREVVAMVDETGYDKFLMKARSRLEKEDAEVKKRIIAYLRNS